MKCPKCQTENPETKKFCGECGTQLTQAEPVQSPASSSDDISLPTKTIGIVKEELTTGATFARRCQMYDLSKEAKSYYITMEYVRGDDLKGMIRRMGGFRTSKLGRYNKSLLYGFVLVQTR